MKVIIVEQFALYMYNIAKCVTMKIFEYCLTNYVRFSRGVLRPFCRRKIDSVFEDWLCLWRLNIGIWKVYRKRFWSFLLNIDLYHLQRPLKNERLHADLLFLYNLVTDFELRKNRSKLLSVNCFILIHELEMGQLSEKINGIQECLFA